MIAEMQPLVVGKDINALLHKQDTAGTATPAQDNDFDVKHLMLVVLISSAGNILEWFDFAIFGYFADVFGELFFPGNSSVDTMAKTFAIFAGAFLMRPIGGAIFGYIGDKYGRKKSVMWSIFLMAFASFSMGCIPTYEQVGSFAPLMLLLVRCLQGVSVGGQLVGAMVYTVESSPPKHQGLVGATSMASSNLGGCLGSAVAAIMHSSLTKQQLHSWGWRIPCWLGALVALLAYYVDDKVHEVPPIAVSSLNRSCSNLHGVYDQVSASSTHSPMAGEIEMGEGVNSSVDATSDPTHGTGGSLPLSVSYHDDNVVGSEVDDDSSNGGAIDGSRRTSSSSSVAVLLYYAALTHVKDAWKYHKLNILSIAVIAAFWPTMYYIDMIWIVSMQQTLIVPPLESAFAVNTAMLLLSIVIFPFAGMAADKYGVKLLVEIGAVVGAITSPIAFLFLDGTALGMATCQLLLMFSLCIFGAAFPTWMVLNCDRSSRAFVLGMAFNLAQAVLGGTAPLIATEMYGAGGAISVGAYRGFIGVLALFALMYRKWFPSSFSPADKSIKA